MLAATSVPTPALIPSRTSSSTGVWRASGMTTPGSRCSTHSTPWSLAVVPGVSGQRGGEAGVVRGPPGPRGAEDGRQAGAQFGVAGPGGGVVDRRVRPRVLVGVPAQQRGQPARRPVRRPRASG